MTWVAVIILLCLSGALAASETSLFSVGRKALERFRTAPGAFEQNVHHVLQNPRRCLLTVLLANNAVNTLIFTLSFVATEGIRDHRPTLAGALSLAVLLSVIIFGEMLPKGVALSNAERMAPAAAMLVGLLGIILAPVRWFLGRVIVEPLMRLVIPSRPYNAEVTHDELRLLLEQSARDGIIDSKENEMLVGAVALGSTKIREVMTPRVDLQFISLTGDLMAARRSAITSGRRTVLVCGRDLDDILGQLQVRDLILNPVSSIAKLMKPVQYVPEQINLVQLLSFFRERKIQSAVVVDEFGGTAGVVSLVDVTKRIVGETFEGEVSGAVSVERIDANSYRLPGDLSVRVWAERFGVREIDGHIDTVAGLILSRLGRWPRPGDEVHVRNLVLSVETMNRRRITSVLVRRDPHGAAALEDAR